MLDEITLAPAVVGREGGNPGSPTGPVMPVIVVMLLCLSFALLKSSPPKSEVASVATLADDVGLPSFGCDGYGSWERNVGRGAVGEVGVFDEAMVRFQSLLTYFGKRFT